MNRNRFPLHLRIATAFALVAFACFALAQPVNAQCPQICDSIRQNTALGDNALVNDTSQQNTAIGWSALESNTTGDINTATGFEALLSNTTGSNNTATGAETLELNTIGMNNTATGGGALLFNTTGSGNTATGVEALINNTTGASNTATGYSALSTNTTGSGNTAIGIFALSGNIIATGNYNTATGYFALSNNTTGNNNIALGFQAGFNLTTGNNNIEIGNSGVAGESKTVRIGKEGTQKNTFIAGISGATVPTGVPVIVDSTGHLGTTTSSERFKDAVKPMDKASEAILALKPVTFRYKREFDPESIPQFGLVAEDVEKVDPDLVARDEQGKPYTVRYEAVNAMLLNEFLKEHKMVQEQGATITQQRKDFETAIAQQQKEIEALTAIVKQQAAQIQRVSAQLELSKTAPQTVQNDY